jgi:hypothetical protein
MYTHRDASVKGRKALSLSIEREGGREGGRKGGREGGREGRREGGRRRAGRSRPAVRLVYEDDSR